MSSRGSPALQKRELGATGALISAVGLGGMLLSIQGRPPHAAAIELIRHAVSEGITLVDTADAYCLDDSEQGHNLRLLREALRGSDQVWVITKVGCTRPGGAWRVDARPERLIQAAEQSLTALGREPIDLLQLHAPDSRVPFAESVGALAELVRAGKVRHVGLSNVSANQIAEARAITPIVSVQNRFNLHDRSVETNGVLDYCTKHRITLFAHSPFGGAQNAPELGLSRLSQEAKRRKVSAYRLVLAWLLAKSPAVVPLFGARRLDSVSDSARATRLGLSPEDVQAIDQLLAPRASG
ncbi:MAG: aldo/keto reductase [Polyangiaceae bacterium]|nr:aldo/keto reductase [Polyangiaceae bacterium]